MLQQPLNLGFSDLGAPSGGVVAIRGRRKERWPHVLPRVPSIPQETRAPVSEPFSKPPGIVSQSDLRKCFCRGMRVDAVKRVARAACSHKTNWMPRVLQAQQAHARAQPGPSGRLGF